MGRREESRQVVLQGFTENTVKCQVWSRYVLFNPIILPQFPHLSPKAIQILGKNKKLFNLQSNFINLKMFNLKFIYSIDTSSCG